MSLLDELLKQSMQAKKAPVQNDIPGGLLAMLTQGNQAVPQSDVASMVMNRPMPQPATLPEMPQYQGGSGIGKSIIGSLLGEWFDERKATKDIERAEAEKMRQAEELQQIYSSGKQGKDLYFELLKARSPAANKVGEKGLEPLDPEKLKMVEMGVEGQPSLLTHARFDHITNSLIPIGVPWKPSSGVTVNTGSMDNMIKDTEAGNMVDAQGNAVKIPVGMTRKEAADMGYNYGKPPTESQGKSNAMYMVSQAITDQFTELLKTGFDPTKVSTADVALGGAADANVPFVGGVIEGQANKNMDPQYQQYRQLQDTWIENFGRDKSGGAIVREEYPNWRRQYWPQQGDNPETIKQKTIARTEYEKGLLARGTTPSTAKEPSKKQDLPIGWTDELEAEYQKAIGGQ